MICPNCRFENQADANFCSNCGHPLRADTPAGPTPFTYTPSHLAEKILAERHSVVGERKTVTVMFADIVDSTAAIAGTDPEEAAGFLTSALDGMMDAIHHYEGTVNELRGDGLMALFGAPLAHEDHAVRAAMAALAIPDSVTSATGGRARTRVGLHTGEVLVRGVGNDLSVEYQALGPTVHLAARMEGLAEPGTTYVTGEVARHVEGRVATESLGGMSVKGITGPVEVWRLTAPIGASAWEVRASRGLTDFTGRQTEIDNLGELLGASEEGHGHTVAIVGDAGVGKSRLLHEFLNTVDSERFALLRADASPFESNTAYHPIKTLVRSWLEGVDGSMDDALTSIDPDLVEHETPFLELLDQVPKDEDWNELAPEVRRRRTREAIDRTIRAMTANKPLVVAIEDLQWVDSETEGVVSHLASIAGELPMLLVVTYRPEFTADWEPDEAATRLHLDQLSPDEAQQFLDCLVGSDRSLGGVKALVAARAEGTPLFLEETVRSLVEVGALTGTRGNYVASTAHVEVEVPDSVAAIVAARIDRLEHLDKTVLQVASVAGESLSPELAARVLRHPTDEVAGAFGRLETREFLFGPAKNGNLEYTFRHALMRDVAYGSLPRSERRSIHGELLGLLEASSGPRPIERLAHHAVRAEKWKKASLYSLEAADKSIERSAYREASTFLREASRALENQQPSPDVVIAGIDVRMRLRVAETGAQGGLARLVKDLEEAADMADSIDDTPRRARLAIHAGYTVNMLGDARAAEEHAATALDLANSLGDRYVAVESRLLLAQSHIYSGRPRHVPELLAPHMRYLTEDIRYETMDQTMIRSVVACAHYAVAEAAAGDFDEAGHWLDEGIAIAGEADRPFDRMYMQFAKGKCLDFMGDLAGAVSAHERSAQIADDADIWFMKTFAQPWRGHALLRSGRVEEARQVLREAEAEGRRVELPFVVAEARAFAGLLELRTGGDPEPDVQAASAFARDFDTPLLELLAMAAQQRWDDAARVADINGYAMWARQIEAGEWANSTLG